jgi:hypothetical protein
MALEPCLGQAERARQQQQPQPQRDAARNRQRKESGDGRWQRRSPDGSQCQPELDETSTAARRISGRGGASRLRMPHTHPQTPQAARSEAESFLMGGGGRATGDWAGAAGLSKSNYNERADRRAGSINKKPPLTRISRSHASPVTCCGSPCTAPADSAAIRLRPQRRVEHKYRHPAKCAAPAAVPRAHAAAAAAAAEQRVAPQLYCTQPSNASTPARHAKPARQQQQTAGEMPQHAYRPPQQTLRCISPMGQTQTFGSRSLAHTHRQTGARAGIKAAPVRCFVFRAHTQRRSLTAMFKKTIFFLIGKNNGGLESGSAAVYFSFFRLEKFIFKYLFCFLFFFFFLCFGGG